jgi:uncharacterized protein YkwD
MTSANASMTGGRRQPGTLPARKLRPVAAAWALVGVLLAGVVAGVVHAPAAFAEATFNQQMLTLLNQARAANGLAALQLAPSVAGVAENGRYTGCGYDVYGRAADMGVRNYFSHTIPNCNNRQVWDMLTAAGVPWTDAAENIGWSSGGTDLVAAARNLNDQFLGSAGHRANILDAGMTHVGIGSWRTAPGQTWSGSGAPRTDVLVTAVVFVRLPATPTTPASLPSIPAGVNATAGNGTANVTWSPAAANGAAIDTYGAFAFGPNGYTGLYALACGTCTSVTVPGLANGASYYIAVYAHNAVGWGGPGVSTWLVPGTPLAPPWATVAPGPGRAGASWGAANGNGSAVDGYAVLAYDNTGFTGKYVIVCGTCTTGTVTGLTAGKSYFLGVFAHNARGWGAPAVTGWTWA